jgi:glucuronate isomerase
MKFITENFLLPNDAAKRLYFDYAEKEPIMDYHCHLPVSDIVKDRVFSTISEAWLGGDHYKWRAMRTLGVPETEITGSADDRAKFRSWAKTLPYTVRNPLYHWSHLELKRYFGIDELLTEKNADEVFDHTSSLLSGGGEYSARGMMYRMNVRTVCTTDDPADDLSGHKALAKDASLKTLVFPAFRPDKALVIDGVPRFRLWLDKLELVAGPVGSFTALMAALEKRHAYFHSMGCRLADYGIEVMYAGELDSAAAERAFKTLKNGKMPENADLLSYRSVLLYELARMHNRAGWVQQYHLGSLRDNNTLKVAKIGQATGFDSIGDFELARSLVAFLDRLENRGELAKTILYVLNPRDNDMIAAIIGSFQDGSVIGKMQFGSGWWFNDHKIGMRNQMNALSYMGFISSFVGMLTDSRSFLSYPRHEYFRRVLCGLFGEDIESGDLPADYEHVGSIIKNICYSNAVNYFRFPEKMSAGA